MYDRLFDVKMTTIQPFEFNESVAQVFDNMVSRSIPFYHEVQRMQTQLVLKYVQPDTHIYDLGCSTATTILFLLKAFHDIQFNRFTLWGIDTSPAMLKQAEQKLALFRFENKNNVQFLLKDLLDTSIQNASVVIMNYVLQFLSPEKRAIATKQVYSGLKPKGILLLSEKIAENDSNTHDIFVELYHQFKKAHGYSDLEIAQKREALENVLIPFRMDEYRDLLFQIGFSQVIPFFRWFNFVSLLCIK